MSISQSVARIRAERGMSSADVARALNMSVAAYEAFEADPNAQIGVHLLATVGEVLGVRWVDLLPTGRRTERAVDALAPLWAQWGPSPSGRAALVALEEWLRWDDSLTMHVETDTTGVDCLANRGAPGGRTSIVGQFTLPGFAVESGDDASGWRALAKESSDAASRIAGLWGQSLGERFDPWQVAHQFGVPAGLAPLDETHFSATVRVFDGYAIVVNSVLNEQYRRRALTHALVHVALGHVVGGSLAEVTDEDDDSIYSCTGCAWELCSLVEWITSAILEPERVAARLAESDEYRFEREPQPAPVRADGETVPYWEQYDVTVIRPNLRRELGLRSAAFLIKGAGETMWPASLAARWVRVAERGFLDRVDVVANFPFGALGCPTIEEVEVALWRSRIVSKQLEAHNDRLAKEMISRRA